MRRILKVVAIFPSFIIWEASSSEIPCTKWEILIKAHEVQAYERKDGVEVEQSKRKTHCRAKFPHVEDWQDKFTDKALSEWPNKQESFKSWSQLEKEVVLKFLNEQPKVFRDFNGITFLRGIKSISKGNPASSVKKLNAIALFDDFFNSKEKSQILSHEFSHLYMVELNEEKVTELTYEMGWRLKNGVEFIRLDSYPLVKEDSGVDISEDLANHFELYLHKPDKLKKISPEVFNKLKSIVGPEFKLEL